MKTKKVKIPAHLMRESGIWFAHVCETFELEPRHIKLLTLACESWDRGLQARKRIAKKGLTFVDRFLTPHPRPEVKIEYDARIAFSRLLRELGLDLEPPGASRPPEIRGNNFLRK